VGTVNAGAPLVLAAVEPPPPQPASADAVSAHTPTDSSLLRRVESTTGASALQRFHPPGAVRAVVEVLLA
jgi:hypothetical protein